MAPTRIRRFIPLPANPIGVAAAACLAFAGTLAQADNRRFTHLYEASTMAPGEVEYEQYITWKTDKDSDSAFDRVDFRHELEFGLTDTLQIGLYLSDWRYQDGASVENNGTDWRGVAVEVIKQLADPVVKPIGVALYGEIKAGDDRIELEGKIILQKNIGKWVFAYNGTLEAEWEGSRYHEDKGVFEQALGASFQFSPSLTAGVEIVHEIEYDDWSSWEDHVLYAGPNVSLRQEGWWVTVTPLFQLTDVESEANLQLRVLFGIKF